MIRTSEWWSAVRKKLYRGESGAATFLTIVAHFECLSGSGIGLGIRVGVGSGLRPYLDPTRNLFLALKIMQYRGQPGPRKIGPDMLSTLWGLGTHSTAMLSEQNYERVGYGNINPLVGKHAAVSLLNSIMLPASRRSPCIAARAHPLPQQHASLMLCCFAWPML